MTNPTSTPTADLDDRTAAPPGAGSADRSVRPSDDGVALGLGALITGTLGVMAALGEVFPDALVFCVVFAGLAVWTTRRTSTRLRWGIAGLVTVFVGVNLVYAMGDLAHPESPAPFVATTVVIAAGLVTIALAVLSARGRRAPVGRIWTVTGTLLVIGAMGALVAGAAVEDDERIAGDVEIVAESYEFPDEVVVGDDADALFVRNRDRGRHTFVIEGVVDAVELPANTDVRIPVDLEPGTYEFICDVAGHDSMRGTLVVVG